MSLLVGLLLLCLSWTPTCSELIDSNDLVDKLFSIDMQDSARMQRLMEIYTNNGVLDRAKYDEELKRTYPRLHMTMMAFRKIYREIDEKDKSASHFIDVLLLTSRQARELEISRKLESEKILENFNTLPQSTKDYLIMKFPLLKKLKYSGSSSTEKPPHGLETSTSSRVSMTRTSSVPSTMVTTTTSPRVSKAEIQKLLRRAIQFLKGASNELRTIGPLQILKPIVTDLKRIMANPLSQSPEDFENVFGQYQKSAQRLLEWCKSKYSMQCETVSAALASSLEALFETAAQVDPANSILRRLSSDYSGQLLSSVLNWDELLKSIIRSAGLASL